ncbi:MAG: LTA synthase family protein [Oscillospiraceae bacterium]|jgi:phosphoglycerol transferase MdoB-like AlkP superfamily enzyme|nr:LTA synthase family protein [Oscillospiraceae bacterium]
MIHNSVTETEKKTAAESAPKPHLRAAARVAAFVRAESFRRGAFFAAVFAALPLFAVYASEAVAGGSFRLNVGAQSFLLASAVAETLLGLLYFATRRLFCAFAVVSVAALPLSIASWFKYAVRGTRLVPTDLRYTFKISELSGGAVLKPTVHIILLAVLTAAVIAALVLLRRRLKPDGAKLAAAIAAVAALWLAFAASVAAGGGGDRAFLHDFFARAGGSGVPASNFTVTGEPPGADSETPVLGGSLGFDGKNPYNAEYLNAQLDILEAMLADVPEYPAAAEAPDVIVYLSESFWDPMQIDGLQLSRDPIENLRRLQSESVHGFMLSTSFGGGTADVEYEVLSGNILRYFGLSDSFYETVSARSPLTLASVFKERGYEISAVHPFRGEFYNRRAAYLSFGIEDFTALEDMTAPVYSGRFVGDDWLADTLIERLSAESDKPRFIVAVSMENHQPFDEKRYGEYEIEALNADMPDTLRLALETSAQGLINADRALAKLTDYLRTSERPAVVLFFGDHQPSLGSQKELYRLYEGVSDRDGVTAEQWRDILQTPFIIWSNYKTEERDLGYVGSNFLSSRLLNYVGGEQPLFYRFQDVVFNDFYGYDGRDLLFLPSDGGFVTERPAKYNNIAALYSMLQYDMVYGEGYVDARLRALRD